MSAIHYFGNESLYWVATPDELKALLTEGSFHLLTVTKHVPVGYTESPFHEFTQPYEDLYRLLAAGERLTWKEHWTLFPCHSPTRDISRCVYADEHTYRGECYKSADCDYRDRCVGMQPFVLFKEIRKNGDFSISKAYHHGQMPENTVGIRFWCPTKRQVWEDGEPITSLKDSPEYADFLFIKEYIRKFTKPLHIQVDGRRVNTGIRISENAKRDVEQFYFFRFNGITVQK